VRAEVYNFTPGIVKFLSSKVPITQLSAMNKYSVGVQLIWFCESWIEYSTVDSCSGKVVVAEP